MLKFIGQFKKQIGEDLAEFLKHSFNYVSAELVISGIGFIGIPIFTRLMLPDDYGNLSLFTSIVSLFLVFYTLASKASFIRHFYDSHYSYSSYIGNGFIYLIIQGCVFLTLTILFIDKITTFFKINSSIILFASIIAFISIPEMLFTNHLQASKNSNKYRLIFILINIVMFIISIIWVYSLDESKYFGRIYAKILVASLFLPYFLVKLVKISVFKIELSHIKNLIHYSLPLIPHSISGIVLVYFDRIIINQMVGSFETGIYSLAYNVGLIMSMIVLATNKSWQPIFFEALKEENYQKINNLFSKYLKILFIISTILIFFSQEIVQLLADKKYIEATSIIPVIVVSYFLLFLYTVFANYAFYRKKTWQISLFTIFAGGINIVLNYALIPYFGYKSAAYTTLLSYFSLFVLHYINVKLLMKENFLPSLKLIIISIFVLLVFVLVNHLLVLKQINYFSYIKILVLSLIAILFFKKKIHGLY